MDLQQEEHLLIEQAKLDREFFGKLYDIHYDRILNYVARRTADLQLAQDITAEVFLKALKGIHTYRWNGVPFSAWLYRIASNEIADYYRHSSRLKNAEMELVKQSDTEDPSIETEMIQAEEELKRNREYVLLHQQIARLPMKYQEVIILRYFEKKQVNEISQILDRKEGTVKSLLYRGLEKLRKNME